jgi:thiamine-phosphate pyrophosphorylase
MRVVVVSPADGNADTPRTVEALFLAGLVRYHLRKPDWNAQQTAAWLEAMPARWWSRVVLHRHHEVAKAFRTSVHLRDDGSPALDAPPHVPKSCIVSRSCHDLVSVRRSLGRYDAVFFGPVYPSLSKPGYGPSPNETFADLRRLLATRTEAEQRTEVVAIGGVTSGHLVQCRQLGFDAVAVLGAVWQAPDPCAAFVNLRNESLRVAALHACERDPS